MEGDGVERRRRDFQAALMRDITPEEEQLIHQSINQELTLPRGITRQDLIKLKEGPINMDIIQVYLTRFLSKQDQNLFSSLTSSITTMIEAPTNISTRM
jgi:hypothetical protein